MDIESSFFSPLSFAGAKRFFSFSLLLFLLSLISASPVSAEPLLCGIDRLEASGFSELSGLKVGLITNVAGVSRNGEPDHALMLRSGARLKFIMAPEHGFSADIEAGKSVDRKSTRYPSCLFALWCIKKTGYPAAEKY